MSLEILSPIAQAVEPLEEGFQDSLARHHEMLFAKLTQVVQLGERICKDLG